MGRPARYIPENKDGVLVEITCRCIGGRALLMPAPDPHKLVHGEPLEGYWFNRSKEWAAQNRRQDYGAYDFATQYQVHFAQLPAFRDLTPEEYQDRVAELILEIEEDGERKRCGDSVAGVEKILSQNPFEPPTRKTKRSPRPLFHVASREAREDLRNGFAEFLAQYRVASEAWLGGNLKAAGWFPEGCFPPAPPFIGPPPPRRPPAPPTRSITVLDSGVVERGEIPVVEIPVVLEARARGQPP